MSLRLPRSLTSSLSALRISPSIRSFTTSPVALAQKEKRKTFNPYAATISKKRKETNIARQAVLRSERAAAAIDPILGHDTDFLLSLDTAPTPLPSLDSVLSETATAPSPEAQRLNHFLGTSELPEFIRISRSLTEPCKAPGDTNVEPETLAAFQLQHAHTVEAIRRILALGNGSNADLTRSNKQMCIDLFGRHRTDNVLPVDPGAVAPQDTKKTPRAGPDTGSSEVQAAILTVKIRALAKQLHRDDGHQTGDKHNKRNLRLMVHRRQKLLKYLKRKEKGGVRYRNVMEALGLDDDAIEKELFL